MRAKRVEKIGISTRLFGLNKREGNKNTIKYTTNKKLDHLWLGISVVLVAAYFFLAFWKRSSMFCQFATFQMLFT